MRRCPCQKPYGFCRWASQSYCFQLVEGRLNDAGTLAPVQSTEIEDWVSFVATGSLQRGSSCGRLSSWVLKSYAGHLRWTASRFAYLEHHSQHAQSLRGKDSPLNPVIQTPSASLPPLWLHDLHAQ